MKKSLSILVVLILTAIISAFTESITITGVVTDSQGVPLAGVNVMLKGSSNGVLTDLNGSYSITVNKASKILVFSFIGFNLVEEQIAGRSIINVKMLAASLSLDEVIVTGYGVQRGSSRKAESKEAYSSTSYSFKPAQPYSNTDYNTEAYAFKSENGFMDVRSNPLSTFSIDVDNASYSNIRRFINNGELPPADAVRIEEMINYFRYDYPEADGKHPFSVSTELAVCPWNRKHTLLQVGLKGKEINKSSLPPSNLVFLIDVSGSMNSPNKLPLLKSAFTLLVNELRSQDRVAIVVYAGAAGLVLESTPGNRKEIIKDAIQRLEAGGSTAGGAGLKLAYAEAEKNFIEGGNNRIILATDGDFNVGESSNGGIEKLVEKKRELGVYITVLGFGMGNIKDDKMEIIADKGNGNYSYIDNLQEARKVLVREFGGTLFTIAKDVKFQIEFNPALVESYRLVGYENRLLNSEDFNDDKKDAGEMGAGHTVTALYELVPATKGDRRPLIDPLKYQKSETVTRPEVNASSEFLTIKLRYKKPDNNTSLLMEKPVKGYITNLEDASDNLKFAAAVSEFGMILANSEYRGNSTLEGAATLARSGRGEDEEGYRAELIRLIRTVQNMKQVSGE